MLSHHRAVTSQCDRPLPRSLQTSCPTNLKILMTEASTQTQDTRVSSGGNRESTPVSTGIRAGSLVLFCILRTLTIAAATTPRILPDESGSWSFSRFIAGGASIITMHQQPEYRFGTGLLLSPLWAVTSDPLVRYRLGLVLLSAAPILAAWCIARSLRLLSLGDNVLRSTAFAMVLLFPATMMMSSAGVAGAFVCCGRHPAMLQMVAGNAAYLLLKTQFCCALF